MQKKLRAGRSSDRGVALSQSEQPDKHNPKKENDLEKTIFAGIFSTEGILHT